MDAATTAVVIGDGIGIVGSIFFLAWKEEHEKWLWAFILSWVVILVVEWLVLH